MTTFQSDRAETQYVEGPSARFAYRRIGPRSGVPFILCTRLRGTIDHWDPALLDVLFTYPGVKAHEIDSWQEEGQTWHRLHVTFPTTIATHNPEQTFYYDADGMQRRIDHVV